MFDGDPSDANYQAKLDFNTTFAFTNFTLERNPLRYEFSSIDMTAKRNNVPKEPDYFSLMDFSAKWDPVPTMLCQNHTALVKGFMGQTTAFKGRDKTDGPDPGRKQAQRGGPLHPRDCGQGLFYLLWGARPGRLPA